MKPASPPAARRIGWRRPALVLAGVLLLGSAAALWWEQRADRADGQARYQFATVTRGELEDVVTATGTLQPRNYVDVGAQVSGQLKKIHVTVGSEVKEGELLAEIDPTVYLARVDGSRAQLRNLRAQRKERAAQVTLATIQLRRQQALIGEDATTREALQVAEATLESTRAQFEALQAQIEQIESTLRADEANLRYARILAPMNGTVVSISARQGQTLNTNQLAPVILRVADLSTMTVQTQVSEADISRLQLGMTAYFTTLGSRGQRWQGTLAQIEPTPTITNNVVLYNALFDVANADRRLMTQMTAQVSFVVAQAREALLIPVAALAQGQPTPARKPGRNTDNEARSRVRVLDEKGELQERVVQIGVSNRIQAQVLSGLSEGERVVSGLSTTGNGKPGSGPRMPARL